MDNSYFRHEYTRVHAAQNVQAYKIKIILYLKIKLRLYICPRKSSKEIVGFTSPIIAFTIKTETSPFQSFFSRQLHIRNQRRYTMLSEKIYTSKKFLLVFPINNIPVLLYKQYKRKRETLSLHITCLIWSLRPTKKILLSMSLGISYN